MVLSMGSAWCCLHLSLAVGCRVAQNTWVVAGRGRDSEQVMSSVCVLRSHLRALHERFTRELHHQVTYIADRQYGNVTRAARGIFKQLTPLQTTTGLKSHPATPPKEVPSHLAPGHTPPPPLPGRLFCPF